MLFVCLLVGYCRFWTCMLTCNTSNVTLVRYTVCVIRYIRRPWRHRLRLDSDSKQRSEVRLALCCYKKRFLEAKNHPPSPSGELSMIENIGFEMFKHDAQHANEGVLGYWKFEQAVSFLVWATNSYQAIILYYIYIYIYIIIIIIYNVIYIYIYTYISLLSLYNVSILHIISYCMSKLLGSRKTSGPPCSRKTRVMR